MPLKLLALSYRAVQTLTWGPESGKSLLSSHCCWFRIPAAFSQVLWDLRVLAWQSFTTVHAPECMKVCTGCSSHVSWWLLKNALLWPVPDYSAETPVVSAISATSGNTLLKTCICKSTSLCLQIWNRKWLWLKSR